MATLRHAAFNPAVPKVGPALKIVFVGLLICLVSFVVLFKIISFENIKSDPVWAVYGLVITAFIFARFLLSWCYRPKHGTGYQPTVAIIVPAYNEPDIDRTLEACLTVDYPTDLFRVVVVDDKSTDDTLARIRAVAERRPELTVIAARVNGGKRVAMAHGIRAATEAEIFVFIDSDSQVATGAIDTLVQYFREGDVGAVAGHTDVANVQRNLLTRMQAMQYYIAFRIYKSAEAVFGSVTCCPGCFSAYRRDAISRVLGPWLNQTFLGRPSTFGDDRSLTNFVLQKNWRVLYAPDATATTNVPEHLRQFLKQQLRWKKSWLREIPRAARAVRHKNPIMVTMFGLSIILPVLAPQVVLRAMVVQPHFLASLPYWYFGGVAVIAVIYGMYYRMNRPVKRWYQGVFFTLFYTFVLVLQMPYAMATIRDSKWGTR
jgi:hyaluronan synthase